MFRAPRSVESVYQNALLIELRMRGFRAEKEVFIPVYYKGYMVGNFRADIFVENCVVIETKAVIERGKQEAKDLLWNKRQIFTISDREAACFKIKGYDAMIVPLKVHQEELTKGEE